jgi:hypothetical protein
VTQAAVNADWSTTHCCGWPGACTAPQAHPSRYTACCYGPVVLQSSYPGNRDCSGASTSSQRHTAPARPCTAASPAPDVRQGPSTDAWNCLIDGSTFSMADTTALAFCGWTATTSTSLNKLPPPLHLHELASHLPRVANARHSSPFHPHPGLTSNSDAGRSGVSYSSSQCPAMYAAYCCAQDR